VPVLVVLGSVAALAMFPQPETSSLWLGGGLLAAGLVAYQLLRRASGDAIASLDAGRRRERLP
jgi:hypothetical protein